MKKFFDKKVLVSFLAGAIMCGSITAFAITKYNSNQVLYEKGNEQITVTNALNDLYSKTEKLSTAKNIINLNSLNVDLDDLKTLGVIPESLNLDNLTEDNFLIVTNGLGGSVSSPEYSAPCSGTFSVSLKPVYDNTSHVISLNGEKTSVSGCSVDAIRTNMEVVFHASNAWSSAQVLGTIYLIY